MAESLKEKDYTRWKDRISVANKRFKDTDGIEKKIKKWREYYRGNQWSVSTGSISPYRDKTVDNMIFSNIKTIMPSINFNDPRIFVQARKKPYRTNDGKVFDTIAASFVLEVLINYYYRELELKRQVDKCVMDALIGPWGIMQLGYTLSTEKVKGDEKTERNELIKEDSPFAVRRSPMDFRVDPEAKDSNLEDANWIAFRWVKSVEDVKNNPAYENTVKIKANVRADVDKKDSGGVQKADSTNPSLDDNWERVEGWDIWDRKGGRLLTLVDNHDKFLKDRPWPLEFGGGFPVEILYFNENPDEIYPVSDVDIYISAQDELNRMKSLHLDHVRRISQRRYLAKENELTLEEMNKLTHGPDGTVVITNTNPANAVLPLQDATVSQDLYMAIRTLKESIRENSGVPQFEKGVAQKFDTATEPALMAQGFSAARAERTSRVERFIKHVARKLSLVLQQTMNTLSVPLSNEQFELARKYAPGKVERIAGTEGAIILQPWLNMDKEDIQVECTFDVEVGSTQPVNDEKRKKDVIALHQMLNGNPYVDAYEGTRRVLEVFGQHDSEKLLRKPEDVEREQMAMAQKKIESEHAMDAPKRAVDLEKTKIKSQTNILTTALKTGRGVPG